MPRELIEQGRRLAECGGQDVGGVAGGPLREVDCLVDAGVEADQDATAFRSHVLDGVAIALRNVADVALGQGLGSESAVRAKHRDADLALDHVMPLVGGRVPVELA